MPEPVRFGESPLRLDGCTAGQMCSPAGTDSIAYFLRFDSDGTVQSPWVRGEDRSGREPGLPRLLDLDHCAIGPSRDWPSNSASCATPSTVTSTVAPSISRADWRPSLSPPPNAMSGVKTIWIDRKRSMPIADSLRRRSATQNRVKLAREEGPTIMTSP